VENCAKNAKKVSVMKAKTTDARLLHSIGWRTRNIVDSDTTHALTVKSKLALDGAR